MLPLYCPLWELFCGTAQRVLLVRLLRREGRNRGITHSRFLRALPRHLGCTWSTRLTCSSAVADRHPVSSSRFVSAPRRVKYDHFLLERILIYSDACSSRITNEGEAHVRAYNIAVKIARAYSCQALSIIKCLINVWKRALGRISPMTFRPEGVHRPKGYRARNLRVEACHSRRTAKYGKG